MRKSQLIRKLNEIPGDPVICVKETYDDKFEYYGIESIDSSVLTEYMDTSGARCVKAKDDIIIIE